jgi:ABC-2 type transport system permease protein
MARIGHILWKEFRLYFGSWMAYALLAGWALIGGYVFQQTVMTAARYNQFSLIPVYQLLIVILIFITPLLTMRLLAEERNTGTIELLFTSALTEWQVALGKFCGAFSFFGVMLLLTLHFPLFALRYGSIDTGPVWGSYIALLCVGGAAIAFGLFCSSLTESQVVAGFLTFGGLLLSWLLASLSAPELSGVPWAVFLAQWSIYAHFENLMKGAVDSKDIIFFLSVIVLFLFATVRVLESRKWR